MAEVLGVVTSIATLVQLTGTLSQLCYGYIKSAAGASKAAERIVTEVSALDGVLRALELLSQNTQAPQLPALELLAGQNGLFERCGKVLKELERRLNSAPGRRQKIGKAIAWPLEEKEINSLLTTVERHKAIFLLALTGDHTSILLEIKKEFEQFHQSFQSIQADEKREKILQWLSPNGLYGSHDAAREKHEENTGDWFLQSRQFKKWKCGPGQFLWLKGIMGCGKTILCSTVIEDLKNSGIDLTKKGLSHFYFDFQDQQKQKVTRFLTSAIAQLACQRATIPEEIEEMYDSQTRKLIEPSVDSLSLSLMSLMNDLSQTYLIVDALDECAELMRLLEVLRNLACETRVSILVTSREDQRIESMLALLPPDMASVVSVQGPAVDADVRLHIVNRLNTDPELNKWPAGIKKEIERSLVKGANGMFRWVSCQLDALHTCIRAADIRKMLKELPKGLYETYKRILQQIPESNHDDVHAILQWLAFSVRPMKLNEVAEAIAIEPWDFTRDPDRKLCRPEDILKICPGLVSISENGQGLRLAHYSVKEYITSKKIQEDTLSHFFVSKISANSLMGQVCLTHLLSFTDVDSMTERVLEKYPLLNYAARHWFNHARTVSDEHLDADLEDLCLMLLNPNDTSKLRQWLWIFDPEESHSRHNSQHGSKDPSISLPLYYACYLGLSRTTKALLGKNVNVNARSRRYGAAMHAASFKGHKRIVEMLLNSGADVALEAGRYSTPLQAAAYGGHMDIVQLLVKRGANIDAEGGEHGTALLAAAEKGDETMVRLLLDLNADLNLNVRGDYHGTAIQAAAYEGHQSVVSLLLDRGADINALSGQYGNALGAASYAGHEDMVRFLLERGADPTASGGYYGTALVAASYKGHLNIVCLLISRNADVDAAGGQLGWCPLQAAAYRRHREVVKYLLESNAQLGKVLRHAAENDHEEIVLFLLDTCSLISEKTESADDENSGNPTDKPTSIRQVERAIQLLLKCAALAQPSKPSGNVDLWFVGAALQGDNTDASVTLVPRRRDTGAPRKLDMLLEKVSDVELKRVPVPGGPPVKEHDDPRPPQPPSTPTARGRNQQPGAAPLQDYSPPRGPVSPSIVNSPRPNIPLTEQANLVRAEAAQAERKKPTNSETDTRKHVAEQVFRLPKYENAIAKGGQPPPVTNGRSNTKQGEVPATQNGEPAHLPEALMAGHAPTTIPSKRPSTPSVLLEKINPTRVTKEARAAIPESSSETRRPDAKHRVESLERISTEVPPQDETRDNQMAPVAAASTPSTSSSSSTPAETQKERAQLEGREPVVPLSPERDTQTAPREKARNATMSPARSVQIETKTGSEQKKTDDKAAIATTTKSNKSRAVLAKNETELHSRANSTSKSDSKAKVMNVEVRDKGIFSFLGR
ncbi:uncharacterized protein Z518_02438 [Rhinocladiella mackenziei CBS 650.93]|uniref:NACHT domain-containing protein n=1 Tax=Rhinocladiella mackenziei CBS 650.93 TaxID=1442369 RepID=A0A0D2IPG9_9EURO|nr:uncharacterized protein Z518_02438 [Rhinocladiella mackenziei CBS 650.93]KIX07784.1 hypothetical protein Z518_02438 [Rhinocladiella mackenziei CBS 650.93]